MSSFNNHHLSAGHFDDRRRTDWQENDRRRTKPWVIDPSDRRSGSDRRLESSGQVTG